MKLKANDYNNSDLIKIIREWTELSQQDFAQSLGLTRSTIAKYERNERNYTFDTFIKICRKHNIDVILEKKK